MRSVPEPDRSEWVARMRERARLDADELVPRPPFRVFGLAAPQLQPVALVEAGRVNGEWDSIGLAYGDWAQPAGPWMIVTTSAREAAAAGREAAAAGREAAAAGREAEAGLLRVIDQERNRIASHAGVDEEDPDEPPDYSAMDLAVGSESVSGLAVRHGNIWTAQALAGGLSLTVLGRGVDPGSVRLDQVVDLAPYLHGRSEMLGRLAEQYRRQPPPVLEPASGVAACRALAEAALAAQARLVEALRAGRSARHRAGDGATMHALWQRAVREQARIGGIGERQADEIVTLMVNHLTHLQEQAGWFATEPRLREAAIDETLRHTVSGEDVPSKPAQQGWAYYWAQRRSVADQEPGPALIARREVGEPLLSAWLQAWTAWAAGR